MSYISYMSYVSYLMSYISYMSGANYKNKNDERKYLNNIRKKQFLKVKIIF